MKKRLFVLGLVVALALPTYALAKEVTLTTQLSSYRGNDAYLAIYLTDSNEAYKGTLWIAGHNSRYYRHLRDWARGSRMNQSEYDGLTGASVTSGRTLKITLNLNDTLIDSGYQFHVDTAVENQRESGSDVVVPLTTDGAGKPVKGRTYVKSFTYDL
jgi:hypothetical protein